MAMGELFTSPREYRPADFRSESSILSAAAFRRLGGITAAKKIAALCTEFGVRTAWQEGGENDPVNQVAAYHVDLTIPSFGIQEENHFPPYVHEVTGDRRASRGISVRQLDGNPVWALMLKKRLLRNIHQAQCSRAIAGPRFEESTDLW